jgi:hypothetical protein
LCLAPNTTYAQSNTGRDVSAEKTAAIQNGILRLEEVGRQKALKGEGNWDNLIAEGAYMIAYDGTIIIYQQGQRLPSLPLKSFKLSEMIVRSYGGETAVVTGLAEIGAETAEKQPFSFQMRFMNVWKKIGDGWKIVVSERTSVKPSAK